MSNTKLYLTTVKFIREAVHTHLDRMRDFMHSSLEAYPSLACHLDARLDELRESQARLIRLQLDLERELANESTLKRVHTDAPTD